MAILLIIAAIILICIVLLVAKKSGARRSAAVGQERFRDIGPGEPKPKQPRASGPD
jgi:hypothetical protein